MEDALQRDADAGENKADADDVHGADTERFSYLSQSEDLCEGMGENLQNGRPDEHDDDGINQSPADALHNALFQTRPVIVGGQRCDRVPQAKSSEENKLLDFVEDAVGRDDLLRNRAKDDVDPVGHKAHQRLHDDGGKADLINAADGFDTGLQEFNPHFNFPVLRQLEDEGQRKRDNLADDRRVRCAGDAHFRAAEKTVNHDWVEDDVGQRAGDLRRRGQDGFARRLQQLFKNAVEDVAEAE